MKRAQSMGGWVLVALLGVWSGLPGTPSALGAEKQDWQLSSSGAPNYGFTAGVGVRF